ncbi:hypothetical protein [Paenibacillus caui]|uniref:hypothetical protein n=1 Tax=Paenibacillus caui TaxID=2873927 RepID=UPI001CA9034E|nr:hypothetical protein [Paenibacillus caui]
MKKKTIYLLSTAALAISLEQSAILALAAPAGQAGTVITQAQTASVTSGSQTYNTFEALLKKSGQLPKAVVYLQQNISKAKAYEASLMTLHLENAQKKQLLSMQNRLGTPSVQSQIAKLYKRGDTFAALGARTRNSSLRQLLSEAEASGYKLETAEGFFFPILDYEKYASFRPYVTADIRSYIDIMAEESKQAPAKDGALVIGYQQIVTRALAQESFILKYPNSNRISQVKGLFKNYNLYTFYGLNNTPLFDYVTKQMQPNAKKGYMAVLSRSKVEASPYLTQLSAFMSVANDNDYKLTDEVEQYRDENIPEN